MAKVYGRSLGRTESWWKLTEGWAGARKVDESWQIDPLPHRKLTEGDGRSYGRIKVNGRCWECAKVDGSWWKIPRPYGMFTEDVTMFCWYKKNWWIVPRMHGRLTVGLAATQKVDASWRKSAAAQNVYGRWLKVLLTHENLTEGRSVTQKVVCS